RRRTTPAPLRPASGRLMHSVPRADRNDLEGVHHPIVFTHRDVFAGHETLFSEPKPHLVVELLALIVVEVPLPGVAAAQASPPGRLARPQALHGANLREVLE